MIYYVLIRSGPGFQDIKGPYISLKIAKYVAYHVDPIPGISCATISIVNKFHDIISWHIEKWG